MNGRHPGIYNKKERQINTSMCKTSSHVTLYQIIWGCCLVYQPSSKHLPFAFYVFHSSCVQLLYPSITPAVPLNGIMTPGQTKKNALSSCTLQNCERNGEESKRAFYLHMDSK